MTQAEAIAAAPMSLWHLAHLLQRAVDDPDGVSDDLYNLSGVTVRIEEAATIIAALNGEPEAAVLAEIQDAESSQLTLEVTF